MKSVLLILATLALGATAWAGDSGCGLGSVIIQKNSKGLQLLSMTTNGILLTQPLGITSGTSGCSSSGLVKNEKEIQYFVEINHDDLSREVAQGHGEKLQTLAILSGCHSLETQMAYSHEAKSSFDLIFPTPDTTAAEIVKNLNTVQAARVCESAQVSSL